MKISRVTEMRNLDHQAITKYGIAQELLMENAGEAAYFVLMNYLDFQPDNVLIICGIGNNGGDGLVVARKMHSVGCNVRIVLMGNPVKYTGSAALNYKICKQINITMSQFSDQDALQTEIDWTDIIIDAIFGTGLDREVDGNYRKVIGTLNGCDKTIISLDIPSGINGDNAQIMGTAINADATVTFGLPKLGNILYPGFDHGGKLFVTHISFPPEISRADNLKIETNDPLMLSDRPGNAHKGSCGKVLFIAGSAQYLGAPYFAALSFLRAGGGLSYLATTEHAAPYIGTAGNEIVFAPQRATKSGSISYANKSGLLELAASCDMVVIGPGISLQEETQKLVLELVREIKLPVLIDGDGLTALAPATELLKGRSAATILTPHPGEMARLCDISVAEVEKNSVDLTLSKANEWNSIVVLKGAHSRIALPDGRLYINLSGNPGMATAGSGDVLTGIIAAMLGQGLVMDAAVRMGVFIHGFAGDLAENELGEEGIIARDIMNKIPEAIKQLRSNFNQVTSDHYHKIVLI